MVELILKGPQGLRGTTAPLGSGCGLVQDTAVTGRVWYSVSGCAPVEGQLVCGCGSDLFCAGVAGCCSWQGHVACVCEPVVYRLCGGRGDKPVRKHCAICGRGERSRVSVRQLWVV